MCRRSFESQGISTLAARFRVWLICAAYCLPWGPSSLTEEHSLLSCSVFVGFSVYLIKLGLILSKNSDIFW